MILILTPVLVLLYVAWLFFCVRHGWLNWCSLPWCVVGFVIGIALQIAFGKWQSRRKAK
jgi:hypothetical protein